MNREDYESWLYIGEGFSAVKVNADGYPGDGMWFFLPDEGITPEQLVENNMLYEFFYNGGKDNNATYRIDLSVPKFDITSETDLKSGLEKLGITEIFSKENADFSPLLGEDMPSWVDTAESAVRVSINEQGVSASSYIIVENAGMGVFPEADEIEFTLDRPFIFVVEKVRMPMFCGIVNEP